MQTQDSVRKVLHIIEQIKKKKKKEKVILLSLSAFNWIDWDFLNLVMNIFSFSETFASSLCILHLQHGQTLTLQ